MTKMMAPEKAFEMYQTLVEGNEQAIPLLAVCDQQGQLTAMGLAIDMPEGVGMQDVLAKVLDGVVARFGKPQWLIFHAEGWVKTAHSQEEFDEIGKNMRPGSFQAEVNAGAQLSEAVTITGVSADEEWNLIAPFVRRGDTVTWEESHVVPATGGIPDLLREAIS